MSIYQRVTQEEEDINNQIDSDSLQWMMSDSRSKKKKI